MLAHKRGTHVQLVSRAGRGYTRRPPALVTAIAKLAPDTLILDGEICVFDQQLISRFEWLRERANDETAPPPIFMALDCLWLAGRDLRDQALSTRRDQLERVLDDQTCPCRRDGSPTTASRRGRRCLSAATRGSLRRTRRRPTVETARGPGSSEGAALPRGRARLGAQGLTHWSGWGRIGPVCSLSGTRRLRSWTVVFSSQPWAGAC